MARFNFDKTGFLIFWPTKISGTFLRFGQKKWAKARFYFESVPAETVAITGFEALWPKNPLFFLI